MRGLSILLWSAVSLFAQRSSLPADPASIAAGGEIYRGSCSGCHGAAGEGSQGPSLLSGRVGRLSDQTLFNSIRNGLPGTSMPEFPLPTESVWRIAAFVRFLSAPAVQANAAGDASRGESLFFGQAKCSGCHMILGRGGHPGPDLSNIGALRTLRQLRESVLTPSARVEPGYRTVRASLADGRILQGVARNYNNYSMQILDSQGQLYLLSRDAVKEFELSDDSLMPPLANPGDLTDLIAFLARQTTRTGSP